MRVPSWSLWLFAIVLTLFSAFFQRMTGPSYALRGDVVIGGREVAFRLPRSHGGAGDAEVSLHVPDPDVVGTIELRRFRSNDDWSKTSLERRQDALVARIPHQPPAGKVMYRISLAKEGQPPVLLTEEPVILRFRGDVPAAVLIPHIALMFGAMLLSTRTGMEALFKKPSVGGYTLWTLVFLLLGGLIGGPLVQKYAFDAFWTGWPFGHDLTDNKTAVAFAFWVIGFWRIRKNPSAGGWVIAASLITLIIFLIPHSLLGSELDYTQMP